MTTNIFPEYSDLGDVSTQTQNMWDAEIARRRTYHRYISGEVFKDTSDTEVSADGERVLLYPAGINVCRTIVLALCDALFGEVSHNSDGVVRFEGRDDISGQEVTSIKSATDHLEKIVTGSNLSSVLWEMQFDRLTFGGSVMRIDPNPKFPGFVRWSKVDLDSFFPVWNPSDPDEILECFIAKYISQDQARLVYDVVTDDEEVLVVERWTRTEYQLKVGDVVLDAFSGVNIWGVVPFVYIPHWRNRNWYGESLLDDIIPAQNQINVIAKDIDQGIHYNTHPTRYGSNLPHDFNSKNYPLAPNAFWDLGRSIGNSPPPVVGVLEIKNPVPDGTFDFMQFLTDWTRTATFAPPVAFGDTSDNVSGSGISREFQLWPLIKSTTRSRFYLSGGLKRAVKITGLILERNSPSDVSRHAVARMLDDSIVPVYAELLPRDRAAIVDEVVKLMSTSPHTISLETAVSKLGGNMSEIEKIRSDAEDETLYREQEFDQQPKEADGRVAAST